METSTSLVGRDATIQRLRLQAQEEEDGLKTMRHDLEIPLRYGIY